MLSRLTKLAPFRAAPLRGLATKKTKPDKPFDKILIANRGEVDMRHEEPSNAFHPPPGA